MQLHGEGYLLLNAGMDAVCILAAGHFLQLPMSGSRTALASLLGGIYALLALWQPAFAGLEAMLASSLCMGMVAYPRHALRGTGGIWLVGLCGNGMAQTLGRLGADGAAMLLGSVCLMLSFCLMGRKRQGSMRGVMCIEWKGKCVHMPVMVDTGNLLRDPVSGLPVVVAPLDLCREWEDELYALPRIRAQTACGSMALPCFRPDQCTVRMRGQSICIRTVTALTEEKLPLALLPASALQGVKSKGAWHADTECGQ